MTDGWADDDSADNLFGSDEVEEQARPWGLVVGPVEVLILGNGKEPPIYDGLAAAEAHYRRHGRPPVVFIEDDEQDQTL